MQRKSIIGNSIVANGIPHSISAGGQLTKLKNSHPPAVSVVTFSADVATLYREQEDPEKLEHLEEEFSRDFDENSGFAIIINGHSLIHCLTPELETRFVFYSNILTDKLLHISIVISFFQDLLRLLLNAKLLFVAE